jgi:hypothetical protein
MQCCCDVLWKMNLCVPHHFVGYLCDVDYLQLCNSLVSYYCYIYDVGLVTETWLSSFVIKIV